MNWRFVLPAAACLALMMPNAAWSRHNFCNGYSQFNPYMSNGFNGNGAWNGSWNGICHKHKHHRRGMLNAFFNPGYGYNNNYGYNNYGYGNPYGSGIGNVVNRFGYGNPYGNGYGNGYGYGAVNGLANLIRRF